MKLIDKNTGKTLYSVLGGENLTLDEAIEWAGAEATEDQTYIIDGEEYSYEDLDWVVDSYQPDDEPEEPKSWQSATVSRRGRSFNQADRAAINRV